MYKIKKVFFIVFLNFLLFLPLLASQSNDLAKQQFQTAKGAFADQFYQAAISLFEKFTNDFPENDLAPEAKIYLAKCHYYQENYKQSLESFQKLKIEENLHLKNQINYWIAKIHFAEENFSKALEPLKEITKDPQSNYFSRAKHLKALLYLKTGKKEAAKLNFQELIKKTENQELIDNSYRNLIKIHKEKNNLSKAIILGEKYLQDYPKSKIKDQIYLNLADSYKSKNNFSKAINFYDLALEETRNPSLRDQAYQGLGLAYLNQGKKAIAKRTVDKISSNQLRLFAQALYYFNSNDHVPALESLSNYLERYPQGDFLAKAYLTKADILYEMGRINDSAAFYQTILEKFQKPEDSSIRNMARYGLAWCYLRKNEFQKAIAEFKHTLEHSNDPAVKMTSKIQIADAHQKAKEFQEALDIYNQILREYPHILYTDYIQFQIGMILVNQRRFDQALMAFNNLINNYPQSTLLPEAKYYKAVSYFAKQQYAKVQELLGELKEKYPKSKIIPEADYLCAKSFFNQEKYNQALKLLKKLIKENKKSPISQFAYIDSGLAHLNLEQFDQAKNIYYDFLKLYPKSPHATLVMFYLGGIYEKEKKDKKAEEYYKKAVQIAQDEKTKQEAWLSLGNLAWNQGNLEKAKEYFKKGSKPDTSLGLKNKLYLAKVYQEEKQTGKALEIYQELTNTQSNIANIALINKAFLFKEEEKYKEAIDFFRQALEKRLTSPQIRFALGTCLERTGQEQKSLEQYFEIIYSPATPAKDKAKAYFRIASIYEKQNNLGQAQNAYKKIIELGVDEAQIARERLKRISESN